MADTDQGETAESRTHPGLVLATVVAAPAALALETALRVWFLPRDFETLRTFLSGPLTLVNWGLCALTLLSGVVAVILARRALQRAKARFGRDPREHRLKRAHTGTFLWSSSIPQLPAIAATIGTLFGAAVLPTVVAISIATVFILALGKLR